MARADRLSREAARKDRIAWVRAQALLLLGTSAEEEAEGIVEEWLRHPRGTVARWTEAVRTVQETVTMAGRVKRAAVPEAPEGLRRREIAAGLRLAAVAWREQRAAK